ncbi:hypothetical protein [Xanthocytophaga agilis]|uniref:Lipoprotein n=1 Tax=Xanthocytophaga agilis TaxID=3048010 RepID=A0AAE3RB03_9BACT|nr:hypothetical protein [Xanthocytophaga agilis]MDJ1506525.1 hypothetical protein [Xanthocytophaga agilis]
MRKGSSASVVLLIVLLSGCLEKTKSDSTTLKGILAPKSVTCEYPITISKFWHEFQQALLNHDKSQMTTLTRFPLEMVNKHYSQEKFLSDFDNLFTNDLIEDVLTAEYTDLECITEKDFKENTYNTIPVPNYTPIFRFTMGWDLIINKKPKWRAYKVLYFIEGTQGYQLCYYQTSIGEI